MSVIYDIERSKLKSTFFLLGMNVSSFTIIKFETGIKFIYNGIYSKIAKQIILEVCSRLCKNN